MAKRKRASLKDKSSETLGTPQKRSKGLDLLFGDPSAAQEGRVVSQSLSSGGGVDELGLPVAMEAPPDDLILASPSEAGGQSTISSLGLESSQGNADVNDLSGLVDDANPPNVEDGNLSGSFDENDLSGLVDEGAPFSPTEAGAPVADDPANDLSGLAMDDAGLNDLSGLAADDGGTDDLSGMAGGDPANDLSGLVVNDAAANDLSGLVVDNTAAAAPTSSPLDTPPPPTPFTPSAPLPQTTAAPINVSSPTSLAGMEPTSPPLDAGPTPTVTTTPAPASSIPPPSTETGAPSLTAPRPAESIKIEALDDGVVETLAAFGEGKTKEDFMPKDELPDDKLTIIEHESGNLDDAAKEKIMRYIGPERRDILFDEIQEMHNQVADKLSGNNKDVSFALDTLRDANEYVIQRPYEYDEALYRVTLVKSMLKRRERLTHSSKTLGTLILIYGLFWTAICLAGFFLPINFAEWIKDPELAAVALSVWYSGLWGGIGGTVEVFWRLYYRVSIKQNFDPQYMMYYIVKPILGFVLGLVMYFLVAVGSAVTGGATIQSGATVTGLSLTMVLGFTAGFRQESVFDMIYVIINRISPDRKKGKGKSSVAPVETVTSKQTSGELPAPGSDGANPAGSGGLTA